MVNPVEMIYSNNPTESTSASNPEEALKNALYVQEPTINGSTNTAATSANTTETLPTAHYEIETEDESTLNSIINNGPSLEYVNNEGNKGVLDTLTIDANGKLTYGDDSKVTHAITGKPIAAYIIEGDPPPPPPAVAGNLSSSGTGDPHFVGLNGSRFDFHGIPGHIFNLLSDAKIQVNSLFNGWGNGGATVMGQIGVRLGNDTLLVNPGGGTSLNGSGFNGTAKLKEGTVSHSGGTTTISTKEYEITIFDRGGYLDIGINTTAEGVNRDEVMPSGIIGQTASGNVDLSVPNFLVHDGIFGTGFASNKFGAKTKIDKLKDKIRDKYDLV